MGIVRGAEGGDPALTANIVIYSQRIFQNEDHRISSKEQLANEPLLVDRLGLLSLC